MKIRDLSVLALFVFLSPGLAAEKVTVPKLIQVAIDASDLCYFYAGEIGDQPPEITKSLEEGIEHDCPEAKRKVTDAYQLFPSNPYLALALLKLSNIGYFDLSAAEQEKVCTLGLPLLKNGCYESIGEDDLFELLCRRQAEVRQ